MKGCALAACALVACGGDDGAMIGPDASASDTTGCTLPALDAPGLRDYLSGIVTALAAAPRATTTQRTAARTYLMGQLTQLGWTAQLHSYATGANVLALIPATTSETRRIIVGAHFDTVSGSPGANDNATGVAAALGVARYLVDASCRRYPVTIALFDEEETGLVGARAYATTLAPADVLAAHTVDQIGWDSDVDRRFELEAPTATLEAEYRAAATVVGVPVTKTSTEGTDHQAFRDRGFAAIGLTEEYVGGDTSPYRHTAQDTAATVDLDYLVRGTQLVAQVITSELR